MMRLLGRALAVFLAASIFASECTIADPTAHIFPVPRVVVRAGDMITDDLLMDRRLVASESALRSYFTERAGMVGKVARQPLPAGAAIPINALRLPQLFKEGDRVVVEFNSGGLRIRGVARALQAGIAGQPARVRNIDTGTVLSGVVGPDGVVDVSGG